MTTSFVFQIGMVLAFVGICAYFQARVENARKRIRVRVHTYNRPQR